MGKGRVLPLTIYANYKKDEGTTGCCKLEKPNSTTQCTQIKRHAASPSCTVSPYLSGKWPWLREESFALKLEPAIIHCMDPVPTACS